jgi:gas vesicle protein
MKKIIKKKKGGTSGGKMLATGVGMALGAGAYYLLGPDSKKHQKQVSSLMSKMKNEVEKEIKKSKEISAPLYHKVVDVVSENYTKQYQMHEPEIKAFAKKLKSEWKGAVKKATAKPVKKPTRVSKKRK